MYNVIRKFKKNRPATKTSNRTSKKVLEKQRKKKQFFELRQYTSLILLHNKLIWPFLCFISESSLFLQRETLGCWKKEVVEPTTCRAPMAIELWCLVDFGKINRILIACSKFRPFKFELQIGEISEIACHKLTLPSRQFGKLSLIRYGYSKSWKKTFTFSKAVLWKHCRFNEAASSSSPIQKAISLNRLIPFGPFQTDPFSFVSLWNQVTKLLSPSSFFYSLSLLTALHLDPQRLSMTACHRFI